MNAEQLIATALTGDCEHNLPRWEACLFCGRPGHPFRFVVEVQRWRHDLPREHPYEGIDVYGPYTESAAHDVAGEHMARLRDDGSGQPWLFVSVFNETDDGCPAITVRTA